MKTLIIYASKHGSTQRAAKRFAAKVSNFELIDLSAKPDLHFSEYDTVYIGTPIYYGRVNKLVTKFIHKNKTMLLEKDVKIFTLGLDDKHLKKTIASSFDKEVLNHAKHCHIGGAYKFEEMSFLERFIVKKVARFTESVSAIDEDKIIELVNM